LFRFAGLHLAQRSLHTQRQPTAGIVARATATATASATATARATAGAKENAAMNTKEKTRQRTGFDIIPFHKT